MDKAIISTIIVALVASLPGLLALYFQRHKDRAVAHQADADASDKISEAALALLKPYKDRVAELEAEKIGMDERMTKLEDRVNELEKILKETTGCLDDVISGAQKLIHQLKSLNIAPVWEPPERRISG